MSTDYSPKENKLKNQTRQAKSMLDQAIVGVRTIKIRVTKIKELIANTQVSNIKRAFWVGFLLGKFKIDFFKETE